MGASTGKYAGDFQANTGKYESSKNARKCAMYE